MIVSKIFEDAFKKVMTPEGAVVIGIDPRRSKSFRPDTHMITPPKPGLGSANPTTCTPHPLRLAQWEEVLFDYASRRRTPTGANITGNDPRRRTRLSPRALCLATSDLGKELGRNEPCETKPKLRSNSVAASQTKRNGVTPRPPHHHRGLPALRPAPPPLLQRGRRKPQRRHHRCRTDRAQLPKIRHETKATHHPNPDQASHHQRAHHAAATTRLHPAAHTTQGIQHHRLPPQLADDPCPPDPGEMPRIRHTVAPPPQEEEGRRHRDLGPPP